MKSVQTQNLSQMETNAQPKTRHHLRADGTREEVTTYCGLSLFLDALHPKEKQRGYYKKTFYVLSRFSFFQLSIEDFLGRTKCCSQRSWRGGRDEKKSRVCTSCASWCVGRHPQAGGGRLIPKNLSSLCLIKSWQQLESRRHLSSVFGLEVLAEIARPSTVGSWQSQRRE